MIEDIIKDAERRMQKACEALSSELAKLRTGRAHPSILEHVMVPYYDVPTALNQVANVSIADARTLMITPWEKDMVGPIEKAILTSDLGLNPATAGMNIRIPMPPLTEERRRDLVKIVRSEAENARIAVRNIRRDMNSQFKELLKEKMLTEDEAHKAEERAQKVTDQFSKQIDEIVADKEQALLTV